MPQTSINQRIKFLLEKHKLSVRAFSELIGQKAANTQNYVGARGSMPGADYLQSITEHFEDVNPVWLLTGKGEPFLSDPPTSTTQTGNFNQAGTGNRQTVKGNKGGTATQTQHQPHGSADFEKDLAAANEKIALLTSQLADKERIIQLLEKSGK